MLRPKLSGSIFVLEPNLIFYLPQNTFLEFNLYGSHLNAHGPSLVVAASICTYHFLHSVSSIWKCSLRDHIGERAEMSASRSLIEGGSN